ncbi:RNA polymerase sigma factor [Flagellimonas lutaonensis]|uniref:RNA polymerase ECF-type sigma factor n=1 Tax=Flagellimonas lutaonensis TaxID=516051 RepID=A0A0D5YU04_9FLAO|nr:RNA polymerase sigma factor [Allomuricauda lutaonensis]AKA35374.1 RNA polymerase ECF-type sigma factor [Allomuricauda lutaonensis]
MPSEKEFINTIKDNEAVLYKATRLYVDNPTDQKDLYQEIVFNLWKGYDSFRGDAQISTWIYRIALNTAILFLKNKKRRGHSVPLDNVVLVEEKYDPVLEERLKILYGKIKELKEVDKGIIFLYLEGKKYDEIATITGLSTSNVGTRMARIKDKLNKKIIKK